MTQMKARPNERFRRWAGEIRIMMDIQPYQQRVLSEKDVLDDKIEKLDTFMQGDIFHRLDIEERNDMDLQLGAMKLYSRILASRIARF